MFHPPQKLKQRIFRKTRILACSTKICTHKNYQPYSILVCMVYACMYVRTCGGRAWFVCVFREFRLHISTYIIESIALVDYFQTYLCDVDFLPREHLIPHLLHPASLSLTTESKEWISTRNYCLAAVTRNCRLSCSHSITDTVWQYSQAGTCGFMYKVMYGMQLIRTRCTLLYEQHV